jgi:selenocysteine lyase/cysteine desulfurase
LDIGKNIDKIREEFPVLKHLTYLNSAAHGPALRKVWEAVQEWWEHKIYEREVNLSDSLEEAAKLIHADKDEVCWNNRVSQGFNMISSMIQLGKGENVVFTELAYPSNIFTWMPYRKNGAKIIKIPHREGLIEINDFEKFIDENTRIVSISEVEWTSGLRYNLKQIAKLVHEHNALLVVDGYQAMGAVDVNVHTSDVDFYTSGSEKWMCCPAQNGVFYIKKSLIGEYEPTYRLYKSVEDAFKNGSPWEKPEHDNVVSYDKPLLSTAEKFYRGNVSDELKYGFQAALKYFNDLNPKDIQERTLKLSQYLIEHLKEHDVKINTPEEPKKRGALVTYTTESFEKNKRLFDELIRNKIIVAHRYNGGVGGIRVSTHFFNTEEDIDKLLALQKNVLEK